MAEKSEVVKNKSKILNNEDLKKEVPTTTEIPPVKFARIVFDATDMNKGFHTMRLNADSPMREIKKLFPKHLGATEDTFMLCFNNGEVVNETPLQLFSNDLEGDDNVILIVKSIKISLGGHGFLKEGRFLDERPNTGFSVIRQKIAVHLKESQALIGLVYNGQEIFNSDTPESVKMEHGDFLEVIKKDKMKIGLRGSIFDAFCGNQCIEIDPNITTMKKIKSVISRHVKEDESKFMLIYKGQELCDQDTPLNLGMSDTDILIANLKFGETKNVKDPMAENEEFSDSEDSFASEDQKDFENLKDILDFIGDADEEELEEIKCLIGKFKSKQAALESEAEAKEEQLEDDRTPESDYRLQEKHECQYEQEIEAPAKRGEEKGALFVKLEPIQEEGVANHVLGSNFENGQHEVKEVTKDGIKQKKKKAKKPYCARGSCPNKGGHKCSRCKAVFYCHQDCLKEDWPHHKIFCDYVYEANKVPDDSTSKNPSEIEDTGAREDVD